MELIFEKINTSDLSGLSKLQPNGWTDITKAFEFYLSIGFCFPIKACADDDVVGLGNLISFGKTAWLSHIIVNPDFRNQGIGRAVVDELLKIAREQNVECISLFATSMGEPVYLKAGFIVDCKYLSFRKVDSSSDFSISKNIIPFDDSFANKIYETDRQVSGEDRREILKLNISRSFLYVKNGDLLGYYLPSMGEGHIVAVTEEAGIELMKYRSIKTDIAVIPAANEVAINFLLKNGFQNEGVKGKRMIFGKNVIWKPDCIYNRIAGNLG
ncbi:MAG: GNAT family N-acetyltransferase [Paludibacter sp.]|nr:GNAT family N-acetyltransferase [Paludibacter sp.]